MTVSAHDVAKQLRYRSPDAGVVKVHKLLYYCQGWHLGWTGRPMFTERIQAWENGPVVADLWHAENKDYEPPTPRSLDEIMLTTVDFVLSRYGRLSGRELITLTHAENPWIVATDNGQHLNAELTAEVLRSYFAEDEEQAEVRQLAQFIVERSDLQRVISVFSRPRGAPVKDDTADLQNLLLSL